MPTQSAAVPACTQRSADTRGAYYLVLFFFSGFPALLYQVVWERALFTLYGVNVEAVTVIVTAFMLGLGLGSLLGGKVSTRPDFPLLPVFGAIEFGIAAFGLVSMRLFQAVASFTSPVSAWALGPVVFALLLFPTILMGCTLPLLVASLVRRNGNVGESVAILYAVNTLGSAVACFLAARFLMRVLGESGTVRLAAIINISVACAAVAAHAVRRRLRSAIATGEDRSRQTPPVDTRQALSLRAGVILAGIVGFIALGQEIIWYRLYSFASGRSAACFPLMLAWYLAGTAYGSFAVRDLSRGRLRNDSRGILKSASLTILIGSITSFLLGPAVAAFVSVAPVDLAYSFVFFGAAFLGAAFPLISHAVVTPSRDSGAKVSYLYLANIIGCASGSYLVGFGAFDTISIRSTSLALLVLGASTASYLMTRSGGPRVVQRSVAVLAAAGVFLCASPWLYARLYEKLLFPNTTPEFRVRHTGRESFRSLVENRSGVVAITGDRVVYGGGVYDGHVSTDLVNDVNGIFRAYAADALHPDPQDVLMIGLSIGSWAQVIANNPRVARLTIVEINPAYLQLIPGYDPVSSLLRNPKVEVVIDDGRRWLARNPRRKFDLIVMNTPQAWLAHASNLVSMEFLRLVKQRLKPGGIHYYNTMFLPEVLLTGATAFPCALRVGNFLALSSDPIVFDKPRWRNSLINYRIDGTPVLDLGDASHRAALDKLLRLADTLSGGDPGAPMRLESAESIRARCRGSRLVTDDNMGVEWR